MKDYGEQSPRDRQSRDPYQSEQRSTERLDPLGMDWDNQEPVNTRWRESRKTRRTTRRAPRTFATPLPSSMDEVPHWLQGGGWRYVAAVAAALILVLMLLLSFGRGTGTNNTVAEEAPEFGAGAGEVAGENSDPLLGQEDLPTVAPPTSAEAQTEAQGAQFVVSNTQGEGLFVRSDHATDGTIVLETLPDGTVVEQIGEDFVGPNYVWRNIRTPSGQEGWVAVDWLQSPQ